MFEFCLQCPSFNRKPKHDTAEHYTFFISLEYRNASTLKLKDTFKVCLTKELVQVGAKFLLFL